MKKHMTQRHVGSKSKSAENRGGQGQKKAVKVSAVQSDRGSVQKKTKNKKNDKHDKNKSKKKKNKSKKKSKKKKKRTESVQGTDRLNNPGNPGNPDTDASAGDFKSAPSRKRKRATDRETASTTRHGQREREREMGQPVLPNTRNPINPDNPANPKKKHCSEGGEGSENKEIPREDCFFANGLYAPGRPKRKKTIVQKFGMVKNTGPIPLISCFDRVIRAV